MIYELRTFQNDAGLTIVVRMAEDGPAMFSFSGHMTVGIRMPDGSVRPERIPMSFPIEAATINDAFKILPALYKQKCDEQVALMQGTAQKMKEAELRNILLN